MPRDDRYGRLQRFEVYDIANNQLTGASSLGSVGLDWERGGFAADPPTGSMGSSGSTSQLCKRWLDLGGWRRRHLEYRSPRGRHITTAVADDASARLRSALRFLRRQLV